MVREGVMTQTGAPALLIVDDERTLRFSIGEWARDAGFRPLEAESGRVALDIVREQAVDVVLLDLKLGDENGLQILKRLREENATLPVIMLTGHGGVEEAVQATRLGAYDFIEKKPPYLEHLEVVVRRALEHVRLREEVDHLRSAGVQTQPLLGSSPALQDSLKRLEKAARSPAATVLIQGETGAGKELMAKFIHAHSPRAGGPFIDLNCAALPEQLLESTLFGHEKGAFTDAKTYRKGLFDLADHGTLFLDEIGEMTPTMQVKLLRAIQEKVVRKVGGTEEEPVDVRIIAATNQELEERIAQGEFREDLFYRINVIPIHLPPLRQRREDIPLLVDFFLGKYSRQMEIPTRQISVDAMKMLESYDWPGNVRELENLVERALALSHSETVTTRDLPIHLLTNRRSNSDLITLPEEGLDLEAYLEDIRAQLMAQALDRTGGVQTQAAELLGMSFRSFRYYAKKAGLKGGESGEAEGEGE